jgi:hypothetical protein
MFVSNYLMDDGGGMRGHGPLGEVLEHARFDPGLARPYMKAVNGRSHKFCTVNSRKRYYGCPKHFTNNVTRNGSNIACNCSRERFEMLPIFEEVRVKDLIDNDYHSPIFNLTSLRKEEWIELDRVIRPAARYRLRFYADVAARNSFGGFNAMAKTILEHETMSDPGEAIVDMDGLTNVRGDSPRFQLQGTPLPVTHSGFSYSLRRLMESRNSGTGLDTRSGEAAARRCAESIEKTSIGNNTGLTYGGQSTYIGGYGRASSVYGLTNFPPRLIKTNLTPPTTGQYSAANGAWSASQTLKEVLAMRDQLVANKFYGPYYLYTSNDWDQFLDNDYILTGGNVATQTLRERLLAISEHDGEGNGIQAVRRLDFLFGGPTTQSGFTGVPSTSPSSPTYKGPGAEGVASTGNPFTMLMVQMTPDVVRAVNGQDLTTIQWESNGGWKLNFMVYAIQVIQLFADFYNNCGILHATTNGIY